MAWDWIYQIEIEACAEGFQASASDAPDALAFGRTREEAGDELREALAAVVRGRMKLNLDLKPPAKVPNGALGLGIAPELAAKADVYVAWRQSGLTKVDLAVRIGKSEKEARRILDPDYKTGMVQLTQAARALGRELIIRSVEPSDIAAA